MYFRHVNAKEIFFIGALNDVQPVAHDPAPSKHTGPKIQWGRDRGRLRSQFSDKL